MSSISSRCLPGCEVTCPEPCAYSRSLGSCVATFGDSTAMVYGPPVFLTFPGPILKSCPQQSIVGSSFPHSSGALPSSSSRMGGSYGSGGMSGLGALSGYGGSCGSGGMSGMGGYSGDGGSCGSGGMSGMGGSSGGCSSYGSGSSSGIGGCYSRRFYSTTRRGSCL